MLYFIVAEKAFDKVAWQYLNLVFLCINLDKSLELGIDLLYKKQYAILKLAGYNSKQLEIYKGVRQECPLLSLLFSLVIETLAVAISEYYRY